MNHIIEMLICHQLIMMLPYDENIEAKFFLYIASSHKLRQKTIKYENYWFYV